jgi:hypothetical protein
LGEPNWPNLPQMPPTQLLPKRRGQLAPTYAFARHLAIGVGMDGQRPCRTLAEDPGRTQPRAAYPRAAAQTRVVSLGGIRLRSWESARVFKGIICADVSEFESYIASQAVGLWPLPSGGSAWCPSARISIPQVITMFYDAACEVHHEHFSRIADRWVRRPKSDLELLDQSRSDGSVSAWVGNGLKTG